MPQARRPWWIVAVALAAGLLVQLSPLNEGLSGPARDAQLRWLADDTAPAGVLVLDIDDASLAALKPLFGPWPFGRDVYALAIERLRGLGAKAIALDVLLVDERPGDDALGRAIARPGAPVILAAAGMYRSQNDQDALARQVVAAGAPRVGTATPQSVRPGAPAWTGIVVPSASVWPAPGLPPRLGLITAPTDADGVLRRLPLWSTAAGASWPLMPLAVLDAVGLTPAASIAEDPSGFVHLAVPGQAGWPLTLPFSAVVQTSDAAGPGDSLRSAIGGRVVFIGSSALLSDSALTVQGQVSGTRVLAHTYAALRDGTLARPPHAAWALALLLLAAMPTAWAVWHKRQRPRHVLALSAATLGLLAGVSAWALVAWRMPVLWVAPLTTSATGIGLLLFARHRAQVADELRLKQELEVSRRTAEVKRQFLAQVSHELRTPMNALLGVAELLQASGLTPEQRRHVQVFRSSGQSLLDLINDLLDLSRIEAGRLDIVPEPFSLYGLLDHLDALYGPRATSKGLGWTVQRADKLPDLVLGDRKRVEQALTNLLGNAIKFTARGSVRLDAQPGVGDHALRFVVRDTGIGIPADRLQAIFQPFEQADRGITRQYGGTGLGLAITRSLAEAMGGRIEVDSAPGGGSTFTLSLPLPQAQDAGVAAAAATAPLPVSQPPTTDLLNRSVLLAEDNEVNVYLFRAMLDGLGLQIDVAPDGLDALDRLRRNRYDMAFIDVQMPGLDGLSVTRELRQLEARSGRKRMPVVALTANAMPRDVEDSLAAGCDRHLSKPVNRSQLLEAVQSFAQPSS